MHARLCLVADSDRASRLAAVLETFGFDVRVTDGDPQVLTGQSNCELWVAEPDVPAASARLAEIWDATILNSVGGAAPCSRCSYKLAVPAANGRCPECGHPFYILDPHSPADATAEWSCPGCGESAPASFERCWRCTGADSQPDDREAPGTPRSRPATRPGVIAVAVALAPWALLVRLTPHLSLPEFCAAAAVSLACSVVALRWLGGRRSASDRSRGRDRAT